MSRKDSDRLTVSPRGRKLAAVSARPRNVVSAANVGTVFLMVRKTRLMFGTDANPFETVHEFRLGVD